MSDHQRRTSASSPGQPKSVDDRFDDEVSAAPLPRDRRAREKEHMRHTTPKRFMRNLEGWGYKFSLTPEGLAVDPPIALDLSEREKTYIRDHADELIAILKNRQG